MELPPGTRLEKTDEVFREAERRLADLPEIQTVSCFIGFGGGGRASNGGTMRVELYPKRSALEKLQAPFQRLLGKAVDHGFVRTRSDQEMAAEIQRRLGSIPGLMVLRANADNSASGLSRMVGGGGFSSTVGSIVLELRRMNDREIVRVAEEIRDRMKGIDGLIATDISWREGKPEVQAHIDRVKAAEYGLSATEIAQAMRDCVEGNISAKLRDGRNQFNIRVQSAELDRDSVEDVANVVVGMAEGRAIRLRDVASVGYGLGPTTISRRHGM